jgi:hypothetical protein
MITGPILSLDLGKSLGWAFGDRNAKAPESGVVLLQSKNETRSSAMGNLIAFLDGRLRGDKPALIVREAPFSLEAYKKTNNSNDRVRTDYGMHGILEGMAERYAVPLEQVYAATVRKYFLGRPNMGNRPATKRAVVERCHLLGLMPKTSSSDDRGDACAAWYWAIGHFGHQHADKLFLFNEKRRS